MAVAMSLRIEAFSVVGDPQVQIFGSGVHLHTDFGSIRVTRNIRQRFSGYKQNVASRIRRQLPDRSRHGVVDHELNPALARLQQSISSMPDPSDKIRRIVLTWVYSPDDIRHQRAEFPTTFRNPLQKIGGTVCASSLCQFARNRDFGET
jgi:hypothetical protein